MTTLAELTAGIPGQRFGPWSSATITDICWDSRQAVPGSLFVALSGQHHCGADYVAETAANGAHAVLMPEMPSHSFSLPPALPAWL